jgi:luciferase family oxidoreductase group 1
MTRLSEIPFSVLDLSPVVSGETPTQAFRNTGSLAQKVDGWGFNRFWLAEHHNMPGIASSATSILIGQVASLTSNIRVGSGGIMLPNHAPLIIAEQFGTLASLYPGRIDLGIGRAPGTDQETTIALRRNQISGGQELPSLLKELRFYLAPPYPGQKVRSIQSEGKDIPIWLLGSSGYSAELAGRLGLPFSFAGHFAPEQMMYAIDIYRRVFTPSEHLSKPYVMMGVNVLIAASIEEANHLATSQILSFLSLLKGAPKQMEAPSSENLKDLTLQEQAFLHQRLQSSIFGDRDYVTEKLTELLERTESDEFIFNTMVYDFDIRLESYRILAELGNLNSRKLISNAI